MPDHRAALKQDQEQGQGREPDEARTAPPPMLRRALAVGGTLLLAAGAALAGGLQGWPALAAAFVTGMLTCAGVFYFWFLAPLGEMAAACRAASSEDLSLTVPERGARDLRVLARVINGMAADFQEVLLLFAHMVRSARHWGPLLQRAAASGTEKDQRLAATTMGQIAQVQEIISDFTYFRVSLEEDAIVDTGVPTPHRTGNAEPGAAREALDSARDVSNPNTRSSAVPDGSQPAPLQASQTRWGEPR